MTNIYTESLEEEMAIQYSCLENPIAKEAWLAKNVDPSFLLGFLVHYLLRPDLNKRTVTSKVNFWDIF